MTWRNDSDSPHDQFTLVGFAKVVSPCFVFWSGCSVYQDSRTLYILPVLAFTFLWNIPRFLELSTCYQSRTLTHLTQSAFPISQFLSTGLTSQYHCKCSCQWMTFQQWHHRPPTLRVSQSTQREPLIQQARKSPVLCNTTIVYKIITQVWRP